jgi:hypothetical protein
MNALRRLAPLAIVIASTLAGPLREAHPQNAHTYFCEIAVPMVARDDRRIEIHQTTYALKLQNPIPGVEVRYTCHPTPVVVSADIRQDSVRAGDVANLNVANMMGLKVQVESRPPGTWNALPDTTARGGTRPLSHFYVEELRADLDVTALQKQRQHAADPRASREELARFDALVAATVECMLDNARRSHPPIRKLKVNVVGWDRYRHYSESYTLKDPIQRRSFKY